MDEARRLAREDEILELLYWLEGEGFAGSATPDALIRFLEQPGDEVDAALDHLVRVRSIAFIEGEYHLTAGGRELAARRFAESFAPLLQQGHGECNDPDCDCHTDPAGAAACTGRTHQHEKS